MQGKQNSQILFKDLKEILQQQNKVFEILAQTCLTQAQLQSKILGASPSAKARNFETSQALPLSQSSLVVPMQSEINGIHSEMSGSKSTRVDEYSKKRVIPLCISQSSQEDHEKDLRVSLDKSLNDALKKSSPSVSEVEEIKEVIEENKDSILVEDEKFEDHNTDKHSDSNMVIPFSSRSSSDRRQCEKINHSTGKQFNPFLKRRISPVTPKDTPDTSKITQSSGSQLNIIEKDVTDDFKKLIFHHNKYKTLYAQVDTWKVDDKDSFKNYASLVIKQFYCILLDSASKSEVQRNFRKVQFFWSIQSSGLIIAKYKGAKMPLKNMNQRVSNYFKKKSEKKALFCVTGREKHKISFEKPIEEAKFGPIHFIFEVILD
ncbi:unnamed protein product [Moneuplotes crassus]|uniref:Uncharacterized protein n=1 Tax=Euplotes crassus TaxID=5936 RepID=A0AAD2DCI4_EUPCR|nr:unnamed protein product [Moneuplotes crassus]